MLEENAFILTKNKKECSNLISFVRRRFTCVKVLETQDASADRVEIPALVPGNQNGVLPVLFMESTLLEKANTSIASAADAQKYVLISFGYGKQPVSVGSCKISDHIDLLCFDEHSFELRLATLTKLKNQLFLLQKEVQSFYEIGKSLSAEKDPIKLFEMIIESSISLTSSDAGTLFLVVDSETNAWSTLKEGNSKDRLLQFAITKNQSMELNLTSYVTPVTRSSISGYTAITGKPLRIDDVCTIDPNMDYRHNVAFDKDTGYKTKSVLSIPMKDHENNVTGVIQLINKKIHKNKILDLKNDSYLQEITAYDPADELIMNSLAGQAAVVLENNLLYRDMNSLLEEYKSQNEKLAALSKKILKAHEEERKRIAREIHDGPAQSMVNISLNLEICKRLLQHDSKERLIDGLDKVLISTRATSREIRTILYDLKPSYLDDGLVSAIKNRLAILKDDTGLEVEFTFTGDESKIEYYLSSTLYRIVQEALSNILKHAEAEHVSVVFDIGDINLTLVISDDGKGFDTIKHGKSARTREGGFGLGGIRERVELISGKISITSAPGKGTQIEVVVPV